MLLTREDFFFVGTIEGARGVEVISGQPTLVWFHADWCHVCQQIKPDVAELGETYEGQVHFVRLNVDHPDARGALRQYRVRATPTFVLIDADGQVRAGARDARARDRIRCPFHRILSGS